MEAVIARDAPIWRDASRTTRAWRNGLNKHAAQIMSRRVDAVRSADCIAVLRELWHAKRETALKLKHRLSAISSSHCRGTPRRPSPRCRQRRPPESQGRRAASPTSSRAPIPARSPGARHRRPHRRLDRYHAGVPLPRPDDRAQRRGARRRLGGSRYRRAPLDHSGHSHEGGVRAPRTAEFGGNGCTHRGARDRRRQQLLFPSVQGKPMSDATLSKLLRENNVGAVPHGFRSSFRDWAAGTGRTGRPRLAPGSPRGDGRYSPTPRLTSHRLQRNRRCGRVDAPSPTAAITWPSTIPPAEPPTAAPIARLALADRRLLCLASCVHVRTIRLMRRTTRPRPCHRQPSCRPQRSADRVSC